MLRKVQNDELRIQDVTLKGQYALQIAFESGHADGIYTFSYLRALCNCEEDRALRARG